jgi:phosphoglycerate dehydrogenase-like enzyme
VPTVLIASPAVGQAGEHTTAPLQHLGAELRREAFWPARPEDELVQALRDVDAVVASIEAYTARVLNSAPRLKVISRTGVGYDAIDVDTATMRGIAICTTVGSNDETVADFAMTLMLALSRELLRGHAEVVAGGWNRPLGQDFFGSTVGIIGLGDIGKKLARRLSGFQTTILAHDVARDEAFASEHNVRYVELDDLLRESDFVSIHAPLLPSTRGMIGERQLRLMKPTAYLVNTARGALIDEHALYRGLKERWIGGAGIDVFAQEPAANSPLLDPSLDNILLAPHMAGVTRESNERAARMACESVAHILGGDAPLHHVVNPHVLRR